MARQPTRLTPAAWELGSELRTLRGEAELSASALGTRMGRSQSHITRWETAKLIPSEDDVQATCEALGIAGRRCEHLLDLARQAVDPPADAHGLPQPLADLIAFEAHATHITQVAPLLVPGLVQTAGYMRSIMADADMSAEQIERRISARQQRQETMLANGARFEALLAERALHEAPCGDDVLAEQLAYLLKLGEHEQISIRMVAMGGHYSPLFGGAFMHMLFERMAPVAHIELHHYSSLVTDQRTVTSLARSAAECRRDAASAEETARTIAETIE